MEFSFVFFRNVLELGSGSGLVGMPVVRVCHPATLTLSDRIENVLQLLRENVKLNLSKSVIVVQYTSMCGCSYTVICAMCNYKVGVTCHCMCVN